MSMQKTWVILGASSPIAKAFSRIAASEKCPVILVGRDQGDLDANAQDLKIKYQVPVHVLISDLADCHAQAGLIENLKNLAPDGMNLLVAFALLPNDNEFIQHPELAAQVLQTNAVAPIHLLESLEPVLIAQGDAHIVVIGSVAGDRGFQRGRIYAASKACLNSYVASQRCRYKQDKLVVTLVKPGFIDTRMTFYNNKIPFKATPEACAFACWQASKYKKKTIYFPWFWRWIMTVVKCIPESILRTLPLT